MTSQLSPMSRRKTIVATTIGNGLEFFDFTIYGFLALVIGKLFFPTFDSYGQLLLTVGSFGVGFIVRPLGGILIGAYADRAGRKKAMTLTIFLMALGCAMIAFAPTYAQIGVACSTSREVEAPTSPPAEKPWISRASTIRIGAATPICA